MSGARNLAGRALAVFALLGALAVLIWLGQTGRLLLAWGPQAQLAPNAAESAAGPEVSEVRAAARVADAQSVAGASATAGARSQPAPAPAEHDPAAAAKALGFRVAPEQRAADLAEYLTATDLAPLLARFQQRAAAGDADAARRVLDILDECSQVESNDYYFRLSASRQAAGSDLMARSADLERFAARAIGWQRCAGVIPSGDHRIVSRVMFRRMREAAQLAADLGNPAAATYDFGGGRFDLQRAAASSARARRLLQEGTAEAVMDIQRFADGTRYPAEAWVLAACELGYPCGASPFLRNFFCAQFGLECSARGWVELLQRTNTPRDWRRLQAVRDQILERWRAGDLEALLTPPGTIGGGG